MFKVNEQYTRSRSEICSKLKIKTPERCHFSKNFLPSDMHTQEFLKLSELQIGIPDFENLSIW